ncbi:hypothetical protein LTR78_001664 [Recurvomyces mirabilis]|uniref:Uncharacterized protein n=1 Tax=Recurvomyces mirabilis TaxID=574656 RepID=A0AAE0WUV6_9PEZI|nr:hypothetical protein LTR78_001664 [Recurvomyces mirabilis]KAK5151766.1 hypothetical protein LTS14_008898 [Recurvomyces mirabilis]
MLTKQARHKNSRSTTRLDTDADLWFENHIPAYSNQDQARENAKLRAEPVKALNDNQHRLLCLGMSLCEIALGMPVHLVLFASNGLRFSVRGEDTDEEHLLDLVWWATSNHTRAAVDWCFAHAKSPDAEDFRQEDILLFSSRILRQLQDCHRNATKNDRQITPAMDEIKSSDDSPPAIMLRNRSFETLCSIKPLEAQNDWEVEYTDITKIIGIERAAPILGADSQEGAFQSVQKQLCMSSISHKSRDDVE